MGKILVDEHTMITGRMMLKQGISDEDIKRVIQAVRDYGFEVPDYDSSRRVSIEISGIEINGSPENYQTVFGLELHLSTLKASKDSPVGGKSSQVYLPATGSRATMPSGPLEKLATQLFIENPYNRASVPTPQIERREFTPGERSRLNDYILGRRK